MKPCFGYIRVSTLKQGERVSFDAQKEAILVFAQRRSLTVTRWYEEKQTAAKGGRSVSNSMLTQVRRGHAQGVIIHKIDHSARNLRDWTKSSELPDIGINVFIDTERPPPSCTASSMLWRRDRYARHTPPGRLFLDDDWLAPSGRAFSCSGDTSATGPCRVWHRGGRIAKIPLPGFENGFCRIRRLRP
ncbi:MAG: hypothetical protein CMF72_19575 [Mameliella sp.]|nr:hypothetical protein [Mameliella sp.]|tara:strand:+ start:7756 stop:8319 length:564 start_codon:yes stop_codon:yes gene_type:complete